MFFDLEYEIDDNCNSDLSSNSSKSTPTNKEYEGDSSVEDSDDSSSSEELYDSSSSSDSDTDEKLDDTINIEFEDSSMYIQLGELTNCKIYEDDDNKRLWHPDADPE